MSMRIQDLVSERPSQQSERSRRILWIVGTAGVVVLLMTFVMVGYLLSPPRDRPNQGFRMVTPSRPAASSPAQPTPPTFAPTPRQPGVPVAEPARPMEGGTR